MNEKLKKKLFDVFEGDFNNNKKKKIVGYQPLKRNDNYFNNSYSLISNENNQSKINELKYNSYKQIKPSQEIYLNSYEDDGKILNIINNYSSRNKKFYSSYFNNNNKNYFNSTTNSKNFNKNNKNFRSSSKTKTNLNLYHHKNPIQKIFDFTNELKTIQIENRKKISSPNKNFINSNKISFPLNLRKKKYLINGAYVTNIFNDSENPFKKETKEFFSKKKKKFLFENDNSTELKKKEKKEKIDEFKEGFNLNSNDIEKYLKKKKKKKINLNINF
jgi:hypothetical protein